MAAWHAQTTAADSGLDIGWQRLAMGRHGGAEAEVRVHGASSGAALG
jgi:hypothetical protein